MMSIIQLGSFEGLNSFREVFARGDYNDRAILDTLGTIAVPVPPDAIVPHYLHLTGRGRKLDTLLRLFLLGFAVEKDAARDALGPLPLEDWIRSGVVDEAGGAVHALVRLQAFRDLLLAFDPPETVPAAERSEQVMGLTSSTMAIVYSAIRRPSHNTLDLGTGSGIQALLAARHSEKVYAVDCSARAIEYARFNAAFNGVAGIEFREGNAFEPVSGLRFDLILSNPPFAVSPSARYVYRDSGMESDQFCRNLVKQAPCFLNEGGYGQMTCDWAHIAGEDWHERLSEWFEGSGCDAWVLRADTQDAADYAHIWIRDTEGPGLACRLYEEWVSYYRRQRIEAISSGLIVIRKASGRPNWVRIEDAPNHPAAPWGDAVAVAFELQDFLETVKRDDQLLEARLQVAPGTALEQQGEWQDSAWRITSARLRMTRGVPWLGNVDQNAVNLMSNFDGRRSVADALGRFATTLGVTADRITPSSLLLIRQLIDRGFLLPSGQ